MGLRSIYFKYERSQQNSDKQNTWVTDSIRISYFTIDASSIKYLDQIQLTKQKTFDFYNEFLVLVRQVKRDDG